MKKIIFFFWLFTLATLFSCGTTQVLVGQEDGWKLLGSEKVNHLREKDVFQLNTTEKFTAIRFFVKERTVAIKSVEITLINGDVLQPVVEKVIQIDDRSRVIELAADGRQLDKIVIRYSSTGKIFSKKGILILAAKPYDPNSKY